MSTSGPLPSTLVSFSDLCHCQVGQKVRFLGCVTNYSTDAGVVTLQHKHPYHNDNIALVDVNLILETIKSDYTRIGEWMNVIGYVTKQEAKSSAHVPKHLQITSVQAIVYWSAGPLMVDAYEDATSDAQEATLRI